jgi:hypothetical protein
MFSPRHGRPFGKIPTTIEQVVASREIGVSSRIILHFQRSSISRQFSSMLHFSLQKRAAVVHHGESCIILQIMAHSIHDGILPFIHYM